MKYNVNDSCFGCGVCESLCPEVFSMTEAGVAVAIDDDVPESLLEIAEEAQGACPVGAIEDV